jgi:hypothetical protein
MKQEESATGGGAVFVDFTGSKSRNGPLEDRDALKRLAWEHGGELRDPKQLPRALLPTMRAARWLWQPVYFSGFWRSIETFSNAELRERIPRAVLEAEGL